MPFALRRSAPLVLLLFAVIEAAHAEDTSSEIKELIGAKHDPGAEAGKHAPLPTKQEELKRLLLNPPDSFQKLLESVPLSIYGKDRENNYVCFCDVSLLSPFSKISDVAFLLRKTLILSRMRFPRVFVLRSWVMH